jgi:endonuclease YncB( thermonuclease family)
LRRQALRLLAVLLTVVLLGWPTAAAAAEVLQVRSGTLLLVGDRNRSYPVELACVAVATDQQEAATAWLRQALPRRSRVNLLPMGNASGHLQARVVRLADDTDLGQGLIEAGLARPIDCPWA